PAVRTSATRPFHSPTPYPSSLEPLLLCPTRAVILLCSDVHLLCSDVHLLCSDVHLLCSDVHLLCSDVHLLCSDVHLLCSDVHLLCSDVHLLCSDVHLLCSDVHLNQLSGPLPSPTPYPSSLPPPPLVHNGAVMCTRTNCPDLFLPTPMLSHPPPNTHHIPHSLFPSPPTPSSCAPRLRCSDVRQNQMFGPLPSTLSTLVRLNTLRTAPCALPPVRRTAPCEAHCPLRGALPPVRRTAPCEAHYPL
ncbi:unnamed protein product, partial [Closterium sp. NIES-65]